METIEQMINRLCPNGVEFVKLVSVCNIQYGYPFESSKFSDDSNLIPLIRIRDVVPGKASTYYSGDVLEEYVIKAGDMLVGMDGNFNLAKWNDRDGLLNQRVCKIYSKDETVFLTTFAFHYLKPLFKKIENEISGGTVKHLSTAKINKIEIPLLPMEVQERIVEILDKMTALTAELQAELQARKLQYEYYCNKLLTFNEIGGGKTVSWMKISEICDKICSGGTPLASNQRYYRDGTIPWLRTQEVDWNDVYDTAIKITQEAVDSSSAKLVPANCVIVAMYGATAAKVCVNKIPLTTNQACCNLQIDANKATYKYVYYWMCNNYFKLKCLSEGAQPNLNAQKIKNFPIPIPSLDEQERIVSILDKFEALTTDLQNGLPAEIEARQKQYEYYRNKLLTFKKAN